MTPLRDILARKLFAIHASMWIGFAVLLALDADLNWQSMSGIPISVVVFLIAAPGAVAATWVARRSAILPTSTWRRRFIMVSPWFLGMQWLTCATISVMILHAEHALHLP